VSISIAGAHTISVILQIIVRSNTALRTLLTVLQADEFKLDDFEKFDIYSSNGSWERHQWLETVSMRGGQKIRAYGDLQTAVCLLPAVVTMEC